MHRSRLCLALTILLLVAGARPGTAQEARGRANGPAGAPAGTTTPASTGDSACDQAAAAWRACIAASPKLEADKAQANTEVDKFVRDVSGARGPHRASLTSACPRTAQGYQTMLRTGTCAANTTGARDDQISRQAPPSR